MLDLKLLRKMTIFLWLVCFFTAKQLDAADADPRLPLAGRRQRRRRPEPQIARRVEPDGLHPWKPRARA